MFKMMISQLFHNELEPVANRASALVVPRRSGSLALQATLDGDIVEMSRLLSAPVCICPDGQRVNHICRNRED